MDPRRDAPPRYVATLAGSELVAPPGTRVTYGQAGYNLARQIPEKVTGLTYERAVASLVLAPLGCRTASSRPLTC